MYHKDSILHPRKIDWMLLQRRDELRNIMQDNGEYFFLGICLGSGRKESIEDAFRLMYFILYFWALFFLRLLHRTTSHWLWK